jgi:UDP:flavonoid glycosyltransferase YjiC (YdhE family)
MHVILATAGIGGDTLPLFPWANQMQQAGHEVSMIGNGAYAAAASAAGIDFTPVISPEEHHRRTALREKSPLKAISSGIQNLLADIQPMYRTVQQLYRPGESVIAAHVIAFGARLFQDRWQAPLATFHISPKGMRSPHDPLSWPIWLPRRMHASAARTTTRVSHRKLSPHVNRARAQIGLPPLTYPVREWMNSAEMVIGFWPEWFAGPQLDWQPETRLVGFPMPPEEATPPLPDDIEAFLNEGEPPLVFSTSTGYSQAARFFEESIQVCEKLGRRGLMLTPAGMTLNASGSHHIRITGPLPHARLYPRAAAAVHHGGVGSAAAALLAGVPQFMVPAMLDHPEVARRCEKLGVADWISPRRYRADAVAPRLEKLLESDAIQLRCQDMKAAMMELNALETATELLEELYERHQVNSPAIAR